MAKCSICVQRAGKRYCPALKKELCSICCGQKRIVEVKCVPTCEFLEQSQKVELEKSGAADRQQPETASVLEIKVPEYDIDSHLKEIVEDIEKKVYVTVTDRGDIFDRNIKDALSEAIKTYEAKTTSAKYKKKILPDNTEHVYYTINEAFTGYSAGDELSPQDFLTCLKAIDKFYDDIHESSDIPNVYSKFLTAKCKETKDYDEAEMVKYDRDEDDEDEDAFRYEAIPENDDEELDEEQKRIADENNKVFQKFEQFLGNEYRKKHNLNDLEFKEYKRLIKAFMNDYLLSDITKSLYNTTWEDLRHYIDEYYIEVDGPDSIDLKRFLKCIEIFYQYSLDHKIINSDIIQGVFNYLSKLTQTETEEVKTVANESLTPKDFIIESERDEKRVAKNVDKVVNGYEDFLNKETDLAKKEIQVLADNLKIFQNEFLTTYLKKNFTEYKENIIRAYLGNWYQRRFENPNLDFIVASLKSISHFYDYVFELGLVPPKVVQSVKKECKDIEFFKQRLESYVKLDDDNKKYWIAEFDYGDF